MIKKIFSYRQWKLKPDNRTDVIPHIRSYFRLSPCSKKLAYYLLTSANFTRSGWGVPNNRNRFSRNLNERELGKSIYMRSYEAGVLFIPKLFDEEYFQIQASEDQEKNKLFPFLFSLPLVPYEDDDVPFISIVSAD